MFDNREKYLELCGDVAKILGCFRQGVDELSAKIIDDCNTLGDKEEALNKEEERQEAERLQELKTMPYKEYLQTPEWQAVRENSLQIAGYRCEVCNAEKSIDIHHRTYERRGEECSGDLVALCRSCHTLFHKAGKLK